MVELTFPKGTSDDEQNTTKRFYLLARSKINPLSKNFIDEYESQNRELLILSRQICLEARDHNGSNPLMHVSNLCYPEVVAALLKRGANIEARRYDGLNPLFLTVSQCNTRHGAYSRHPNYISGYGGKYDPNTDKIQLHTHFLHSVETLKILRNNGANFRVKAPESGKSGITNYIPQNKYLENVFRDEDDPYPAFIRERTPPENADSIMRLLSYWTVAPSDSTQEVPYFENIRTIFRISDWSKAEAHNKPENLLDDLFYMGRVSLDQRQQILEDIRESKKEKEEKREKPEHGRSV